MSLRFRMPVLTVLLVVARAAPAAEPAFTAALFATPPKIDGRIETAE